MSIKGIFFDFDNTTVDDYDFIIECFRKSFLDLGEIVEYRDIERLLGREQRSIIEEIFSDDKDIKKASEYFDKYYFEEFKTNINIFPEIIKVLTILQRDYRIALITGAPKDKVKIVSEYFDISKFYSSVVTSDDVLEYKPNSEGLLLTLDRLNLKRDEVLYIGDANEDLVLSKNVGVKFLKAGWADPRTFNIKNSDYTMIANPMLILDYI
jgi:HAD superfamily hydrolase (TIGR01549 family)